jgi:hypothetical protein
VADWQGSIFVKSAILASYVIVSKLYKYRSVADTIDVADTLESEYVADAPYGYITVDLTSAPFSISMQGGLL